MDRTIISNRINRIMGDISKLSNTLCAIDKTDIEKYPDNYTMLTTDAALRSELIACRMRHLLYGTTTTKKETYLASAGVVQGICIKEYEGVLEITLPCLLPKRKQRQSTEFLIDPLYFTLSQYADSHQLPKYKGYSGTEIANIYGVKPNLVGAWISKAVKKLEQNRIFIIWRDNWLSEIVSS